MFSFHFLNVIRAAALCFGLASLLLAPTPASANETTANALAPFENPHFDVLLVADDIVLPNSRRIFIAQPEVTFSKEWMRQFKRSTSAEYRDRTISDYAIELRKRLQKKLADTGWQVVETQQEDALLVEAMLTNLHINAPDSISIKSSLVQRIGTGELKIKLVGLDGNVILKASDIAAAGSGAGRLIEADNAANFNWFSRLMGAWAAQFAMYTNAVAGG